MNKKIFNSILIKKFSRNYQNYKLWHKDSIDPTQRDSFWKIQAEALDWIKFPSKILDSSQKPFDRWYKDGVINMSYTSRCIKQTCYLIKLRPLK